MAEEKENELFQFVITSLEGLNHRSYRRRAKLMLEHFKVQKSLQNVDIISCEAQVGSFVTKLFMYNPSFEETLVCRKGCDSRDVRLAVIAISDDAFERFEKVFVKYMDRAYRYNKTGCLEYTKKENVKIGKYNLTFNYENNLKNGSLSYYTLY